MRLYGKVPGCTSERGFRGHSRSRRHCLTLCRRIMMMDEHGASLLALDDVKLSQSDIPGSELNNRDPRTLRVSESVFWLRVRRLNSSGTKKTLVDR